jgi:hypothetical protein
MAGFIATNELDFFNYREDLKEFLKQQHQFRDYDFDGPNIAVLLDLLAYNTYHTGIYLNLIGSEMFLDTASLRESIVSHAKELNYTPRSRVSSVAFLDITVSGNNMPAVLTIPKNYQISGRSTDGKTYTFLTNEAINVGSANNYTAKSVPVYEGKWIKEVFVANSSARYVLESANVDINSIEVQVQVSASNTEVETWNKETTLFGLTNDVNAFFVQGYEDYKYEITFGNGIVGRKLTDGNIIRVSYRTTLGEEANGIKTFVAQQAIGGFSSVTAVISANDTFATGGSLHESDEEVKFNAPRYFQTQERAVTEIDYVTLLKNQFPQLSAITAFGGESVEPKKYGKTIISAKPRGATILSNSLKDQMVKFLNGKTTLSIDPIIIDPDYFNVTIGCEVTYNLNATVKTTTELISTIQSAIIAYNDTSLDTFSSDLRYSRLVTAIDNADASIVSNDTTVLMTKKLYPLIGELNNYEFIFSNELAIKSGTVGSQSTVYSSPFQWKTGATSYNAYIEDDGNGTLQIATLDSLNNKVILWDKIGTVNYSTGRVAISNLVVQSFIGTSLNIYATLSNADIETNNNQILTIDPSDIQITVDGIRV